MSHLNRQGYLLVSAQHPDYKVAFQEGQNKAIVRGVLDRMLDKITCPQCGYMDYHCEFCNYQWSIRRSRDA